MKKVLLSLRGKRTYLVALIVGVIASLEFLGVLDAELGLLLKVLLLGGGLATLRAGISNK